MIDKFIEKKDSGKLISRIRDREEKLNELRQIYGRHLYLLLLLFSDGRDAHLNARCIEECNRLIAYAQNVHLPN